MDNGIHTLRHDIFRGDTGIDLSIGLSYTVARREFCRKRYCNVNETQEVAILG